ncbi:hypothetical protein D9615_008054 [Tricholomella constricta]|uniref:Eukaryotic translation initiation factor 5B n=1 Tax=Tricholomella constricta TaxID=117010 RepID=A0A8H5GVV9_9AGAR|nr:hypothetical protein D9615_008054 [Tricholomella constricta]
MPPKNKGKKGKKGDDDFWDKAGETVQPNALAAVAPADDEDIGSGNGFKGGFSGYAALNMADDVPAEEEEGEEDFGGLMSTLKATATKGKKEKKKAKKGAIDLADLGEGENGDAPSEPPGPITVTADDLDDEWGPVKDKKKKKDKKGKGKKGKDDDEEEKADSEKATPASAESATLPNDDDVEEADDAGPKVLSKKEKEKLKKEREKAKKKAQAAAKKAEAEKEPAAAPTAAKDDSDEEGDEAAGEEGGDSKKKKKKKKGKKDEAPVAAPAPAPTPAAGGKKKGGISALRALMDEKKRIEEEAKRLHEEELRRIEEEERKAEEEERKKEEERQKRKDKEKAKKELAKKEGRLLTKKQKEEKQMAEIRKQALLASGVQIEGLQQPSGSAAPKKVVYGNRKKKGPTARGASKEASPAPESRPRSPEPVKEEVKPAKEEIKPAEEPKDEWDASSEEEEEAKPAESAPVLDGVKDDWDASTEEEEEAKPAAPAPTEKKAAPAPKGQPKAQPTQKPAVKPTPVAKAAPPPKTTPAKDEESEEEDSSESDSDSSDDSEEDSDEDSSEEESSSDEELTQTQKMAMQRKAEAAERRKKTYEAALAARSKDDLRSPICCILGHVDTGKTKLLDKIRQTNVQEGEAGGITQQIGATYFPVDAIKTKTTVMNRDGSQEYNIPGLLIIDTPGHESFTNLRSRGSSLCNIAILVVDIMHGLEAQTLESLRLLRDRKTPFIVALNKIDRIYSWDPTPDGAFRESLEKQSKSVQREFEDRVAKTILAFAQEGLNACLYYDNKNFARNVSLVPTSAITGEGVPDMIMLLVNLTQQRMSDRLMYLSELECTVLEVKVIEGLGTTIDVVLSNGILREGDRIVVCGLNGPIVTQVRALLTPQPLRELRIKSAYVHHKEVKAALGVKITAPDLEKAIAGSRLLVVGPDDDEDDLKEEIMSDLTTLLNSIDKSGRGVCVQASTLGSLEALLDFLKVSKIPVSGINIGPVHKKDIMRAATMLEKAKELACILCFDVPIDKEAERLAEEMGIRLFKADIIYHLFDSFKAYNDEITEAKRKDAAPQAVWPCRLRVIAAFCKRDPIILGVDILDGSLRVGTPLAVVKTDPVTGKKDIVPLGKITSLEINHKTFDIVKKAQAGAGVAVKIEHAVYQSAKMFGRHFDDKDELLSHISRQSIDVLKSSFKADVSMEEWHLIKALKP